MSKAQASRSHPEDSRGEHSKASQKPAPAHSSSRENVDVEESRGGGVKKVKAIPAHIGHANLHPKQEGDGVHNGIKTPTNRQYPGDAKESVGAAASARRAGPHGSVVHADGSTQATPSTKRVARFV